MVGVCRTGAARAMVGLPAGAFNNRGEVAAAYPLAYILLYGKTSYPSRMISQGGYQGHHIVLRQTFAIYFHIRRRAFRVTNTYENGGYAAGFYISQTGVSFSRRQDQGTCCFTSRERQSKMECA